MFKFLITRGRGARYLWLLAVLSFLTQAAFTRAYAHQDEAAQTSSSAPYVDGFGRDTPRGTVLAFLSAAERHDYDRARRYLATPGPDAFEPELTDQLAYVLNHAKLEEISDRPEGASQLGLARGVYRITVNATDSGPFDLYLDRIDEEGHWVWVFSAETLSSIPAEFESMSTASTSHHLPRFLAKPMWLFVPLWKYLALLTCFALALAAIYAVRPALARIIARAFVKESPSARLKLSMKVARPLGVLLWLAVTEGIVRAFGLPLLARERWYALSSKAGIAVVAWLMLAIVNAAAIAFRLRSDEANRGQIAAVVRLGQRTVSFLCIFAGFVIILRLAGYDITAFLAGLGVGGLAIAFAAQKTLENLFGGVSIILDRPIHVGDECRIDDTVGTVVDIGLRSTRLRTLERTIMTVPNGKLSTMTIENLSMRDAMRFCHVLKVQTENGTGRLEAVLEALGALLLSEPTVDPASTRVRLIRVEAQSSDVELLCLIRTRDRGHFLAVQQDLLLRCLRTIDAQNTSLSLPSSVVHLAREESAEASSHKPGI